MIVVAAKVKNREFPILLNIDISFMDK